MTRTLRIGCGRTSAHTKSLLSVLKAGPENGIEVFLTGDQTLSYEKNLAGRAIAIVASSSVEWDILKNHLSSIIAAIDSGSSRHLSSGGLW